MNTRSHCERNGRIRIVSCCLAATMLAVGLPAFAADITFFAYSDCHYGATPFGRPMSRRPQVEWINNLPGTAWPESIGGVVAEPKGVIMAGDLIDHGAVKDKHAKEWADYIAEFGVNGEGRVKYPVFEGLGNHDWNPDRVPFEHVKKRNQKRLELGHISHVSDNGYHYSWDWDGIHFINLNIFPGNQWHGEADTYSPDAHHPEHARDFLKKDLREKVGDTGWPVIIVFHFRPIDENWWTYSAIDKFHRIIQDYNVILLMVGHQGGGVNNVWRGINWASSNGVLEAFRISPDNVLVGVSRKDTQWGRPMRKKIYLSYKTSRLPAVVNNGDWVSNVTHHSATLSGKILYQAVPQTEATVYWGTEHGGDNPDKWQHAKTIGAQQTGEAFHVEVRGLKPWTQYHYRCRVRNAEGDAWAAASIPFTTRGLLPKDWDTTFVGYVQRPWGGAHQQGGVVTLRGSGRDIGERGQRIDNFQYAFTRADGDVEIQARLTGMQGKTRAPKAGVMLRETIDKGAASFALLDSKRDGVRMFVRDKTDGLTQVSDPGKDEVPGWLKLVRRGDIFTGYKSDDGRRWTQVGEPVNVKMPATITTGLAVTVGNRDGSRHQTATFDKLDVTPAHVLDKQQQLSAQRFWVNRDFDWFKANIPFFECPDDEIVTTYYYRWELVTRHICYGSPNSGYSFTEFANRPFWSGRYGAIACPSGHQLYEVRWLHDPQYARDYLRYWFRTPGAEPRRYSSWLADSAWATHRIHPNDAFLVDLMPDLAEHYEAWKKRHWVGEMGLFWQLGHDDGMEFDINARQTRDILRGGQSLRPSFNAYMWADARALARIAALAGDEQAAAQYRKHAATIKTQMQKHLWDPKRQFFFPMSNQRHEKDGHVVEKHTLTYETGEHAGSPHGRELHGYVPWAFAMPDPGYEAAWKFLMDPAYFYADYGPTTVERNDPMFVLKESCCWWSGQSWPFATTQTLKAMANVLQDYEQKYIARRDYVKLLYNYAVSHRKQGRPYIAEALNPFTGSWKGHDMANRSEHYFHSGFTDLIITGLCGLKPRDDDKIVVDPLAPDDWPYFALDDVSYKGHRLTVLWDKTGHRYGHGPGLHILVNGNKLASAPDLQRLEATLPSVRQVPRQRDRVAANQFEEPQCEIRCVGKIPAQRSAVGNL